MASKQKASVKRKATGGKAPARKSPTGARAAGKNTPGPTIWEWPLRWSEIRPGDTSEYADGLKSAIEELGRDSKDWGMMLHAALLHGVRMLEGPWPERPEHLESCVKALSKVLARKWAGNSWREAHAAIVGCAVLSALGFDTPDRKKLDPAIAQLAKERTKNLEWIDRADRAELAAALTYFDRYEEAAVWSDAGKVTKRPAAGLSFPWSVGDSLRYLTSAYAASAAEPSVRPAWRALVAAFPRQYRLRKTSLLVLAIAAADYRRRFHPDRTLAEVMAEAEATVFSGLSVYPKQRGAQTNLFVVTPHGPYADWSAALRAIAPEVQNTSLQLHTHIDHRRGGMSTHLAEYMTTVGLVGQLRGHLTSHLMLYADLVPSLMKRFDEKNEALGDSVRVGNIVTLMEAFGIDHPESLEFPLKSLARFVEASSSKTASTSVQVSRVCEALAVAAYRGPYPAWREYAPYYDKQEILRAVARFLRAFHDRSGTARRLGIELIERIPRDDGEWKPVRLSDALLIARAIAVHIDGGSPSDAGTLLREVIL